MTKHKLPVKFRYILILALIMAVFFPAAALADDTEWVDASGVMSFGMTQPENPANAYAEDDQYAGFQSIWSGMWWNDQAWYTFTIGDALLPDTATITGIEIHINAYRGSDMDPNLSFRLYEGMNARGDALNSGDLPLTDTGTYISLGGSGDTWNYNGWTAEKIKSGFSVLVKSTNSNGIAYLDHLQIKVYYTMPATHTINASAASNGTIDPDGAVAVPEGADQTFTITPNSGFIVDEVTVDGFSFDRLNAYELINVAADHTIHAAFSNGWTAPTACYDYNVDHGSYAYASDNQAAVFDYGDEYAVYYGCGALVPDDALIKGIQVSLEGYKDSGSGRSWNVALSWDSGWHWTAAQNSGAVGPGAANEQTFVLGGLNDNWGYGSWTDTIVNSDNFRIKVSSTNGGNRIYLDQVQVKINHEPPAPVNHAPVADDQSVTTDEDISVDITLTASDADFDPLTYTIVDGPDHGLLSGGAPDLTYTPDADYNGTDCFTFKANDGTADSNIATVSITVAPINDPPAAADDAYATNEDTLLSVSAANGVLQNDSDIEGDPLNVESVETPPAHGTLVMQSDGSFTYMPDADYYGTDSFVYVLADGYLTDTATVSITVAPVNDPPVANSQSVTTDEDTAKTITLTGFDVDHDPLTYTVVDHPAHGVLSGSAPHLTYTPDLNYNGSDSVTFKVNDGMVHSALAAVSIIVDPVNDAPVLASIGNKKIVGRSTLEFRATATDVDLPAQTLTFSLIGEPKGAEIDPDSGKFTWRPSASQVPGTYYLTVRVADNGDPRLYDEEEIRVSVYRTGYTFKITASAGKGGDIDPEGDVFVYRNADVTFTIDPDKGYVISDVLVDNKSVGPVEKYKFKDVAKNHTIKAIFTAVGPSRYFVDLDPDLWYREGIDYVLEEGLFQGVSAINFAPDRPMTRAMFVTVLHRLDGWPDGYGDSPFTDVANNVWYTPAIIWAADNNIVTGYNAKTFGPNDYMTREQMVTILYRYTIYKGYNLSASEPGSIFSYVDYDLISEYAVLPMQWAFRTELIEGLSAATLNPKALITRAQAATIIMRYCRNVVE